MRVQLEWIGAFAFVAALVTVVAAAVVFFGARFGAPYRTATTGASAVWLAVLCYATSHALRVVRLAILAGDPRVSVRQIGFVHLLTAAVSLMTPFKLGEVYRIAELSHLLRNGAHSLVIVWVERAFDSAAISVLILIAFVAAPAVLVEIRPLVFVSVAFVATTLVLFTIVPEGLRTLSLFVIRRYDGQGAVRVLQALQWLGHGIALGPKIVARKVAALLVLTLAIWALELTTLSTVTSSAAKHLGDLMTGLPVFLSSQSLSGILLVRSTTQWQYGDVIASTLLILGSIAGLLYAPVRLRDSHLGSRSARRQHVPRERHL